MKHSLLFIFFIYKITFIYSQNPSNADFKGEPDGPYVDYYAGGKVLNKLTILNGNVQGDRYGYYKNGKLMVKEQFDKGEFYGTNFMLNKNGDTVYIEIYKHDTLIFTKNFEYYKNNTLLSRSMVYYKSDSTSRKNPFKVSKAHKGIMIDLDTVEQICNNTRVDVSYYKSGQTMAFAEMSKFQYNGKYIQYYENGKIRTNTFYKNDKKEGEYHEYYPSGEMKVSANYKNDNFDGEYKKYDEKGKVISTEVYKDGVLQK